MAKKNVTVEKFDDRKQESVIDFGSVKVPTSWDEVTLQTMCDYMRRAKEKEDLLENDRREVKKWNKEHPEEKKDMPDEKDSKYTLTDKDLLEVFTDFDISKYDILPVELYNSIMGNFSFVLKQMDYKPSKELEWNGQKFIINDMEGLCVKEYEDAENVMKGDPFDYPSLLAILCRLRNGRKTDNATGLSRYVNEPYDTEFANKVFDARRHMFANMPVPKAMPMIAFFLMKSLELQMPSQKYMQTTARRLDELVTNILDSAGPMAYLKPSTMLPMIRLRKLRKSVRKTFLTS